MKLKKNIITYLLDETLYNIQLFSTIVLDYYVDNAKAPINIQMHHVVYY